MKMRQLLLVTLLGLFFSIAEAQYMLYGTTSQGGIYNKGCIYRYNPITNTQTVLFSFDGTDGNGPDCKLLYASDSLLYGTTNIGGTRNMGTVFSFNLKTNTENVIINYDSTNGYINDGGNELIQAKNGFLYGTSWLGGLNGAGVLYRYDIARNKDTVLVKGNPTFILPSFFEL